MNSKQSHPPPRARQQGNTPPAIHARSPARGASRRDAASRGTRAPDPPPIVVAPRTRLIRFRLNPRSEGDQQILGWLAGIAPYYRADAIRTALLTHILRRHGGGEPAPAPMPLAPPAAPTAAQKLEKMFST
jgi:hypothetical protein